MKKHIKIENPRMLVMVKHACPVCTELKAEIKSCGYLYYDDNLYEYFLECQISEDHDWYSYAKWSDSTGLFAGREAELKELMKIPLCKGMPVITFKPGERIKHVH